MKFYEKSIWQNYRTPLEQTMRRPVWEPPDIDVVGIFEHPDVVEFMEEIEEHIPDPVTRCAFLDAFSEYRALNDYYEWATDAARAAVVCGNRGKETFYTDLINAMLPDLFEALDEWVLRQRTMWHEDTNEEYPAKEYPYLVERYRNEPFRLRDNNGDPFDFAPDTDSSYTSASLWDSDDSHQDGKDSVHTTRSHPQNERTALSPPRLPSADDFESIHTTSSQSTTHPLIANFIEAQTLVKEPLGGRHFRPSCRNCCAIL